MRSLAFVLLAVLNLMLLLSGVTFFLDRFRIPLTLTALLYAADRTVDREERKRLLHRAQAIVSEAAPEIPLYSVTRLDAVPASLQHFKGNPTNTGIFWNVHEWEIK